MNKLRWTSIALAVSIAINLAFVGMIVGRHFGGMRAMGPPPGEQRAIDRLAKDMSADGGQKLRAAPYRGNGMIHEIDEVHACLRAGRTESATVPLSLSIATLDILDRLRA